MFCFVGLTSVTLVYLTFIIFLYFIKLQYSLSYFLAFITGTAFSFFFNKRLSFGSKKYFLKEIWIYFIIYFTSLILGGFLLRYLVNILNIKPLFATIPVFMFTIAVNFLGSKLLVFKDK